MHTSVSNSELPDTEHATGYFDPTRRTSSTPDDNQLACCWSENKPAILDTIMAGIFGLSGIGSLVVGFFVSIRPNGTGVVGGAILAVLGALLLVAGFAFLLYKVLRPQYAIAIYPDGIEIVRNRDSQKYLWKDIHKILTLEFTPHLGAKMMHVVWIEPVKGDKIRFDTSYEGDANEVLEYLTSRCDYIVRNPSGYSKRTC